MGEMAGLESLGLVRCPRITGAGMAHLDGLKHLEVLSLEGSPVGDDGMKSVAGHDSLRRLYLGWPVSRKGLAELVRLKSLDELTIYGNLKDDDFVPIGQMTNLKSLRFAIGGLTDEGLRHLSNMTRLRSLNLTESQATDAGMAFVGQMTGLEVLTLNERIGDAGIAHLIALPNLQGLSLRTTKVSDAGIATLIGLPKLRRLDLVETHVTAVGVEHLRGMKSLESIDLSYTEISDGDVRKVERQRNPSFQAARIVAELDKQVNVPLFCGDSRAAVPEFLRLENWHGMVVVREVEVREEIAVKKWAGEATPAGQEACAKSTRHRAP